MQYHEVCADQSCDPRHPPLGRTLRRFLPLAGFVGLFLLAATRTDAATVTIGRADLVTFPASGWWFAEEPPSSNNATGEIALDYAAPLGGGSIEMTLDGTGEGRMLFGTVDYNGTRLDQVTSLSYRSVRTSVDTDNSLSIALQVNVDYDGTDGDTNWQGRLVFEPSFTAGSGEVDTGVWYHWNTLASDARWWMTADAIVRGVNVGRACDHNAPCSLATILTHYPDAAIHSSLGALFFKAGAPWSNFSGQIDDFVIGVAGNETTYDYQVCPDGNPDGADIDGDGISDICDAEDAPLSIKKATAWPWRSKKGRAKVEGSTLAPFDASRGFTVRISDGGTMNIMGALAPSDCETTETERDRKIRCRTADKDVQAYFYSDLSSPGDPAKFKIKVSRREFEGPLAPPIEATLEEGFISRFGAIQNCVSSRAKMSCK